MKRSHEESEANSQTESPFNSSSLGESFEPSHPHTSNEGGGANRSSMQNLTMNDARNYFKLVQDTLGDQTEKYSLFLHALDDFGSQRLDPPVVTQRVKELFVEHRNLIPGFNMFCPTRFKITLEDEDGTEPEPQNSRPELAAILIYLKKIKERDGSVYRSFIEIISMYRDNQKSITEVAQEVRALLVNYKDLLDEFTSDILPNNLASAHTVEELGGNSSEALTILEENRGLESGKEDTSKHPPLDLSRTHRSTPSNQLFPNDHHLSVTSGTENYTFKHTQPNPYEESLFKCAHDIYELDMLVETFSSYAGRIENLLDKINNNSVRLDGGLRIDDHFTATDGRCVEQLYGTFAREVIGNVRENPTMALPVILARLRQKVEEFTASRPRVAHIWAETYAKNIDKARDQRGCARRC